MEKTIGCILTPRAGWPRAQPVTTLYSARVTETAPDPRTQAQIEADLEATRDRLAGRLHNLAAYVTPKAVVQRQVDKAKSVYVDEFGGIRPTSVLVTAGVVIGYLAIHALRRRRR